MSHWYVVHTQCRKETLAATHLDNQGFEAYVPRYRKRRRHARKIEDVLTPPFPRYLFVRIDTEQQRWRSINGTMGVCYLLCDGDHPLSVPAGLVESIKDSEQRDGAVAMDPRRYNKGQELRVVQGPFADLTGLFQDMADDKRVFVLLNILGRHVRTRLPIEAVAAA